jgi:hypothetical protein
VASAPAPRLIDLHIGRGSCDAVDSINERNHARLEREPASLIRAGRMHGNLIAGGLGPTECYAAERRPIALGFGVSLESITPSLLLSTTSGPLT